ncbi:MAG: tripartite tricarboxylate transporter TctB family protein [Synergistaceae bacterium]|nr:tripartite tricarboxylate transporter TctB family protein [Synergistaceae bacterium]
MSLKEGLKESQVERYAGGFFALFSIALYFFVIPWQIRRVAGASPSPRSFPLAITATVFALSASLFVSGWHKRNREDQKVYLLSAEELKLAGATLLVMGAYTALLYAFSYVPVTIVVLAVLIRLYGQRTWWKLGVTAIVLPPLIFAAFTYLLKLRLP